jgi:choline dehydrogenase
VKTAPVAAAELAAQHPVQRNVAARVLLLEAGSAQPLDLMAVPPAWPGVMGTSDDGADQTVE